MRLFSALCRCVSVDCISKIHVSFSPIYVHDDPARCSAPLRVTAGPSAPHAGAVTHVQEDEDWELAMVLSLRDLETGDSIEGPQEPQQPQQPPVMRPVQPVSGPASPSSPGTMPLGWWCLCLPLVDFSCSCWRFGRRRPREQGTALTIVPAPPPSTVVDWPLVCVAGTSSEGSTCVICQERPSVAGFMHGRSMHKCARAMQPLAIVLVR